MGCASSKEPVKPELATAASQAGSGVIKPEDKLPPPENKEEEKKAAGGDAEPDAPVAVVGEPEVATVVAEAVAAEAVVAEAKETEQVNEAEGHGNQENGVGGEIAAEPDAGEAKPEPEVGETEVVAAPEATAAPKEEIAEPKKGASPRGEKALDAEEWAKENPVGLYLTYVAKDSGTFMASWSKTFEPEALAFVRPSSFFPVPEYKFKKPSVIQSRVDMGRTMYYQAWCQFLKEARACSGEVVLFPKVDESERVPLVIWLQIGEHISRLGPNQQPVKMKFVETVAAATPSFDRFNVNDSYTPSKFIDTIRGANEQFHIRFEAAK